MLNKYLKRTTFCKQKFIKIKRVSDVISDAIDQFAETSIPFL